MKRDSLSVFYECQIKLRDIVMSYIIGAFIGVVVFVEIH